MRSLPEIRRSPYVLGLIFLFFFEVFVVKSTIFYLRDPVRIHYFLSAIMGIAIIIYAIRLDNGQVLRDWMIFYFLFSTFWCLLSSTTIGLIENYIYSFSYFLMMMVCLICLPYIFIRLKLDFFKLIYKFLGVMLFFSIILHLFAPNIAADHMSGRFQGAYISVANASLMVFFTAIISFHFVMMAIENKRHKFIVFHFLVFAFSVYVIYLTKTRSIFIELFLICVAYYSLRIFNYREKFKNQILLVSSILFVFLAGGVYFISFTDTSDFKSDYRLEDSQGITASRGGNWEFAIERIGDAPLFGEGLLTKQTQGGSSSVNFNAETSYDPRYDPHSLILSFGVQAGIPFMVIMTLIIVLILWRYVKMFGTRQSLTDIVFLTSAVHFVVMMFSGGDLTSFGSLSDRIYLIMLGTLSARISIYKYEASRNRFVKRTSEIRENVNLGGINWHDKTKF